MSIKIKIGRLVGSHESGALSRLADASMPINTAMRLTELYEDIQGHLLRYEKDRIALLQKHSPKNDDGTYKLKEDGSADLSPDQIKAFQDELGLVLHTEVELCGTVLRKANLLSSTAISPNDLRILEWLIPNENKDWPENVTETTTEIEEAEDGNR